MQAEFLTESWMRRWRDELNGSAAYRHAARHWEWPVVLVVRPDPEAGYPDERAVYLDVYRGVCRDIRVAEAVERNAAKYVIEGSPDTWRHILHREMDPVMALMHRKLHLSKGGLLALSRHMKAARELVVAAARATAVEEAMAAAAARASSVPAPTQTSRIAARRLEHDTLPMRLYHQAKRLGVWDPLDLDFTRDQDDWIRLSSLEREVLLRFTVVCQASEDSVSRDLLPLLLAVTRGGHLDEQLYLSTLHFEEAKHVEFCRRVVDEVARVSDDLAEFRGPAARALFYEMLPTAMRRLLEDASPAAQVEALVTYAMIVKGTLAEWAYHGYYATLEQADVLPGVRGGVDLLLRDEARHITYGVHALSRLVAADPDLWFVLQRRMELLLPSVLEVIHETFGSYETLPFDLKVDELVDDAVGRFEARVMSLQAARDGGVEDVPHG